MEESTRLDIILDNPLTATIATLAGFSTSILVSYWFWRDVVEMEPSAAQMVATDHALIMAMRVLDPDRSPIHCIVPLVLIHYTLFRHETRRSRWAIPLALCTFSAGVHWVASRTCRN